MSNQQRKKNNQEGIDIRQALEILSVRAAQSNHHGEAENNEACHHHGVPQEAREWGQRIDLTAEGKWGDGEKEERHDGAANDSSSFSSKKPKTERSDTDRASEDSKAGEDQKRRPEEERTKRQAELVGKLQTMSVRELLRCVLESQQQRVATYKAYDIGLEQVLQTGNMSHYPAVVAEATASFAVLSDTIRAVVVVLEGDDEQQHHRRPDLSKLIERLQQDEQEKLNLTAALHLEKIRESGSRMATTSEGDERITGLLQQGVRSLQVEVGSCIERINETLEELRFALQEEQEDEI
jgi:hypothetical protein